MDGTQNAVTWETTDLGSAAYANLRGLSILGVTRGSDNKFTFRFADPGNKGQQLQIDYINSDCRRFDEAVRSLKKLCYDPAPTRQGAPRHGARR